MVWDFGKKVMLTLTAILLAIVQTISASNAQSPLHGEVCSPSNPCDKSKWLTCNPSGICICYKEGMIYDNSSLKCKTRVGETCVFEFEESGAVSSLKSECVSDAYCEPISKTCKCYGVTSYPAQDGSNCILKGVHGTACDPARPCSEGSLLECVEGLCNCGKSLVYDTPSGKCQAIIGTSCQRTAEYPDGTKTTTTVKCVGNGTCYKRANCKCLSPFIPSPDNTTCLPPKQIGEKCENSEECFSQLKCVEGTCACELLELYQEMDYTTWIGTGNYAQEERRVGSGTCSKKVGMVCSWDEYGQDFSRTSKPCRKNAYCSSGSKECVCQPGFTATDDFGCGQEYGADCDGKEALGSKMMCDEGKVSCHSPSYQIYQEGCKSLVGVVCTADEDDIPCVAGASCKAHSQTGELRCQCKQGFVANKDSSCDIAYGEECGLNFDSEISKKGKTNFVCDRAAGLRCKNGKCGCKNKWDSYVEDERRCVAPLGYPCKKGEDCASNATCEESLGGIKQCV